jgi:hypothetical protein
MEGLFYFHGMEGVTFLWFYPDSRVISGDNSTKFDQYSSQWFEAKPYKVHYFRGTYTIGERRRIRIVIRTDYGTLVYRGTINKDDAIELTSRCPFTNHIKSATYLRFSEGNKITHMKISDVCVN